MIAAELLARYAADRDAEAFAALVKDYQAMVFATCRRRVKEPADVNDAVQETFLRLARNADALRTNVAAWLHRCAMNVSTDLNRRAETRRRHESAAPPMEAASPDAQRELAELREHLDAALAKLDEPSRELILQRYFIGRSQTDLAAEIGVTPAAISQRLSRAIVVLREHLTAAGGSALAGVGVNGLPSLLTAEHASAHLSTSLTAQLNSIGLSGTPARAVATRAARWSSPAVGAAAVVLLIVGAILSVSMWPQGMSLFSAAPTTQPGPQTGITVQAGSSESRGTPTWDVAPATITGVLAGRITDADGKPIVVATVTLQGDGDRLSAKTDAEGRYRFATIHGEGEFRVGVTATGFVSVEPYANDRNFFLHLSPDAQAQRNWVLQRAVAVKVKIADARGEPLSQLHVSVVRAGEQGLGESALVDAHGDGVVWLPDGDGQFVMMVIAKNRAPTTKQISPKDANGPAVRVAMVEGIDVSGTAICSDDKPATGWSITATPADWPGTNYPIKSAPVDVDGHFTLHNVPVGSHEVSVSIPDGNGMWFAPRIGRFELAEHQPLKLKLPMKSPGAMVAVTGHVKWSGDADAAAQVWMSMSSLDVKKRAYHSVQIEFKDTTDEAETFTVQNVEPGEYRVRFEGTTIENVTLDRVTIPGELPLVELHVIGKAKIEGIVTDDATGQPVTSFAVRVRKLRTLGEGPNYTQSDEWAQVSDAAGHYSVELVGPGEYQVQISTDRFAWVWSKPLRAEKPGAVVTADVKLTAGGTLSGVVRDPAGAPVSGAKVIPFSKAQSMALTPMNEPPRLSSEAGVVVTDAEGRYVLEHLAAGDEKLKIVHPNVAPLWVEGAVVEGQRIEVTASALKVGGAIDGVVRDGDGKPAANVPIAFQDAYGYSGGDDERDGVVAQVVTDKSGHYRVEHLAEQTLYANLGERWTRSGISRRMVHPIDGRAAKLDFGGTTPITGRLMANGSPKANWKLYLTSGDRMFAGLVANVVTDADGRFTLRGVPAGRYVLYTDAGEERIALREITVGDDPIDLGEVIDDRGRVIVTIDADDPADAASIQDVLVTLDPAVAGWALPIDNFKRDGDRWVCDGVPAGRSNVQFSLAKDGILCRANVTRQVGEGEKQLSLHVPKQSATLRGPATTHPAAWTSVQSAATGGVIMSVYVNGDPARAPKLAPGDYIRLDPALEMPIPNAPPITLKAGETAVLPVLGGDASYAGRVQIVLWSAEGELLTAPKMTITDAAGQVVVTRPQLGHESETFAAQRTTYTVRVDRPGQASFEQTRDFSAVLDPNASKAREWNVVLPD